jgi:hypothetical protein
MLTVVASCGIHVQGLDANGVFHTMADREGLNRHVGEVGHRGDSIIVLYWV